MSIFTKQQNPPVEQIMNDHPENILTANNISIGYRKGLKNPCIVHQNLSFHLSTGELTCLIGPNGAGKSTLLRSLAAAQPLIDGVICLYNKPLSSYSKRTLSSQIGLVLTDRSYAGALKVKELVALGRYPYTGFFGHLSNDDLKKVEWAMNETGIFDKHDQYVAELSDGERQKAMIAKALCQESSIIILDEPTSFLDISSRIEIMSLLRNLAVEHNKAILLSTHDLEQALISADKLWMLSNTDGMICGTPEDLVLNGKINNLFKHKDIFFDLHSGNFRQSRNNLQPILVESDDEIFYWVSNFLNRYGYYAVHSFIDPEKAFHHQSSDCDYQKTILSLKIQTTECILITNVNKITKVNSFEALSDYLKKRPNTI